MSIAPSCTVAPHPGNNRSLRAAVLAFDLLGRVARSGLWISSHVSAIRSVDICRLWADVFAHLREHCVFLHVACDACRLSFNRAVSRWHFTSICKTAGVRGHARFCSAGAGYPGGENASRKLSLARASLSIIDGDDDALHADPMPLIFRFADAKIRSAAYRQRVTSRLAAIFLELGISRVADVQPGVLFPFFDEEVRRRRMTAGTAKAYRTAIWAFCRWLVKDLKCYSFARTMAELDVQGVKQTAMIRGGRQSKKRGTR